MVLLTSNAGGESHARPSLNRVTSHRRSYSPDSCAYHEEEAKKKPTVMPIPMPSTKAIPSFSFPSFCRPCSRCFFSLWSSQKWMSFFSSWSLRTFFRYHIAFWASGISSTPRVLKRTYRMSFMLMPLENSSFPSKKQSSSIVTTPPIYVP